MKAVYFFLILVFAMHTIASGQDPHRFDAEIDKISNLPIPQAQELSVFTGSSSIRFWSSLEGDCSAQQVVNTGFGGSHMSDLLYFLEETVIRFKPIKIYIYEGDNDIVANKDPAEIIETAKQVVAKIQKSLPHAKVYFISAKPSPSRWEYKESYESLNQIFREYCDTHNDLYYIDVWSEMLDQNGRPMADIFIDDELHMNESGYKIWKRVICNRQD